MCISIDIDVYMQMYGIEYLWGWESGAFMKKEPFSP